MAETERRMLLPARRVGCSLVPIGVSRLPDHRINETIRADTGTAWHLVDWREDPARDVVNGKNLAPPELIPWLHTLDEAKVRPQLLIAAHEQHPDWKEGDPYTPVPAPRHLQEKDERLRVQLGFVNKLLLVAVGGLLAVAAAPVVLAGAAIASVGLDPVLFGGVKHPELPLVEWVYICSWEW
jgi:hypothetical protein